MLDSASEESDKPKKNTANRTRLKPDGKSTAVLNAHAQIQNKRQKNFETKPVPILPVQNLQTGEPETGQQMWKPPLLWKHPLLWKQPLLMTVKLNRM